MHRHLQTTLETLRDHLGDRLSACPALCAQYGASESWMGGQVLPDAVASVQSTSEVARVLKACNASGVPVVPFGAGSSIEGQVLATEGGVSLDLTGMNSILAVNEADMDCTVQCGVTARGLNEALRATGLFFPVDLGAHATLGGMAATRASGTTTVRYGSMRDLVLSLTVVLPDGEIIKTGTRARKSSAGYDLTHLFVGSEGSLGVITDVTLRLFGRPDCAKSALCSFPDLESATQTVVMALHSGLCLNRIEIADMLQMRAINQWCKTDLPETPTLWLELTGSDVLVEHDLRVLEELTEQAGAIRFEPAKDRDASRRLWRTRHEALYAARALRPGTKGLSTDVCVPISTLPECITRIQSIIADTSILAPLIGHAGDGNFHLVLLFDPEDPAETLEAKAINAALVDIAQGLGGTCTGEHGVGLGKKAYMEAEHGPALGLMRKLKQAIDPNNIMNPGKMFDLSERP